MKNDLRIMDAQTCTKKYISSVVDKEGPQSIVVYGPMTCGKTRNAEKLAEKFGFGVVIDNAGPRAFSAGLPMNGVLIICEHGTPIPAHMKSMSFDEAIAA